jgi:hypothetical protein
MAGVFFCVGPSSPPDIIMVAALAVARIIRVPICNSRCSAGSHCICCSSSGAVFLHIGDGPHLRRFQILIWVIQPLAACSLRIYQGLIRATAHAAIGSCVAGERLVFRVGLWVRTFLGPLGRGHIPGTPTTAWRGRRASAKNKIYRNLQFRELCADSPR